MQFNSIQFMIFFPIVTAVYFLMPKKGRLYWLLAASYFFYMSRNAKYAALIGFSTLITYGGGIVISVARNRQESIGKRKAVFICCICMNLGILALFKYGNFSIETINRILSWLHWNTFDFRFHFILPVGISFYTFQALGYLTDVYRGDIAAEKNLFRFALFISFFPKLAAGPIERSGNFLPQLRKIEEIRLWDLQRITSGSILMLWGLFMKMVITDRLSILTDTVFDLFRMYGSTELIIAAISFTLQIYCDFGSYSLIAAGAAKIFGFDLTENFNTPYFSTGIQEFWTRWHISLSTWFRDYLYIPLGGNRKGKIRTVINKMIVFLVSGLWHGANWTFVMWGGIHGLYLVLEGLLRHHAEKLLERFKVNTVCFSWKLLKRVVTFSLAAFAWIFFRADSVTDAFCYITRIFTKPTPWVLFGGELYNLGLDHTETDILLFAIIILFLVDLVRAKKGITLDSFLLSQNLWFRWVVMIGIILMIITFGKYGSAFDANQFIYFQF